MDFRRNYIKEKETSYRLRHGTGITSNVSVRVPGVARYVPSGNRAPAMLMFHENMQSNDSRLLNSKGHPCAVITMECNSVDESGFCKGHEMSFANFIKDFCGGMIPSELEEIS